jgi:UDP-2-acetamido-3-amino-2,3-dideoxy-glucuronate N-acetyltransferase
MHFKHNQAIVETPSIGEGTRIWAFSHILPGARIGRDCNICDHTFIENDVVIGDRVTVKCGVQLWDGITIEDDVFIGPNATFTNDHFPRSRQRPERFLRTLVRRGASIGANATILPGLVIGEHAMIGAGAVLTKNAPPNAILVGNPARITGYTGVAPKAAVWPQTAEPSVRRADVEGVLFCRLPLVDDLRGSLSFGEIEHHIPFPVKRYFVVFGVSSEEIRGEHAHKTLHQFLVCVHGSCRVVADDGLHREEFVLDSPDAAVYIPPMVWAVQYKHSLDAVLLVLASDYYDASDYIRDYSEFLQLAGQRRGAAAVSGS